MCWSDLPWIDHRYLSEVIGRYGSPVYLFRPDVLLNNCRQLQGLAGFGDTWRPFYMAKANWLPQVLKIVSAAGVGVTVSSEFELAVAQDVGVDPDDIVVAGPAKSESFLLRCIRGRVNMIMVESHEEALAIENLADKEGRTVRVGCRCSLGLGVHRRSRLLSCRAGGPGGKFGWPGREIIDASRAIGRLQRLKLCALSTNLGSQICRPRVYCHALQELQAVSDRLRVEGLTMTHINIGGGFAVSGITKSYPGVLARLTDVLTGTSIGPRFERWRPDCAMEQLIPDLCRQLERTPDTGLMIEPGRWMVAESMALLVTIVRVVRRSTGTWVYADGGIDVLPDAGFGEQRPILAVLADDTGGDGRQQCRIAGPLCLKSDIFTRNAHLPRNIREGDFLLIHCAGAYGFSRASWFGGRLPGVVAIDDGSRETQLLWPSLDEEQLRKMAASVG